MTVRTFCDACDEAKSDHWLDEIEVVRNREVVFTYHFCKDCRDEKDAESMSPGELVATRDPNIGWVEHRLRGAKPAVPPREVEEIE